ncbi:MAG: tRNA (adenosine(37)-N6)-threonylcarbamoyltransferase complex ATPase subunit type 1 TsaE [Nitrospiraceae bacterium]
MRRPRQPQSGEWTLVLRSVEDTGRWGRLIGQALTGGEVLGLCGDLGSGKTTLVRGIAEGLDAEHTRVTSPTFILIHQYHGRLPLIHADLYRLGSETEMSAIGLDEYFNETTVAAIEWADKFAGALPVDRLDILLDHRTPRTRCMTLKALGSCSERLLTAIRTQYRAVGSTRGGTRNGVKLKPFRRSRS